MNHIVSEEHLKAPNVPAVLCLCGVCCLFKGIVSRDEFFFLKVLKLETVLFE
jgi:hypothetical protein